LQPLTLRIYVMQIKTKKSSVQTISLNFFDKYRKLFSGLGIN
jgi:hypothetical protein